MIVASLFFVVVSAVGLAAGLVLPDELFPLIISAAAALFAALFLYRALRRTSAGAQPVDWAPPVPPPPG